MDSIPILCSNMFLVSPLTPVPPVQRPETVCERWRASLLQQYGGQPDSQHYLPQCDSAGEFNPVQCYGDSSYCWCVDQNGREVPGTRSHDAVKPACECRLLWNPVSLWKKHRLNVLIFGHFILFPCFIFKFTFRIKGNKMICFSQLKWSATF